jgi:hypothetical protein
MLTNKPVRVNRTLWVDSKFYEFIRTSNTRVAALICNFETLPEVRFIAVESSDTISYLPEKKNDNLGLQDPFSDGIGRVKVKVGRIVNKLFSKEILQGYVSPRDVEHFVNSFKSHFDEDNQYYKIVEGEEIKKWYLEDNYLVINGDCRGTLWNSCMRYYKRQPFLDMYSKNSSFKMLCLLTKDEYGEERVRARALLVDAFTEDDSKLPKGTPVKFMDRIYAYYDSDFQKFTKWADENGYIYKYEQNSKSKPYVYFRGEGCVLNMSVKLENYDFRTYPYLDTFSFFNKREGILYNFPDDHYQYELIQADGNIERQQREENTENAFDLDMDEF